MAAPPEDVRPGSWFSARWLNRLAAAVRAAAITSDGSILVKQTDDGQLLKVNAPQVVDVKISGGKNPYAGVEQRPIAGGVWEALPSGRVFTIGGDPLYERNGNPAVSAGTYVRAERNPQSARWIFDRAPCTAPAPAPAPAPSPAPAPGPLPTPSPGGDMFVPSAPANPVVAPPGPGSSPAAYPGPFPTPPETTGTGRFGYFHATPDGGPPGGG